MWSFLWWGRTLPYIHQAEVVCKAPRITSLPPCNSSHIAVAGLAETQTGANLSMHKGLAVSAFFFTACYSTTKMHRTLQNCSFTIRKVGGELVKDPGVICNPYPFVHTIDDFRTPQLSMFCLSCMLPYDIDFMNPKYELCLPSTRELEAGVAGWYVAFCALSLRSAIPACQKVYYLSPTHLKVSKPYLPCINQILGGNGASVPRNSVNLEELELRWLSKLEDEKLLMCRSPFPYEDIKAEFLDIIEAFYITLAISLKGSPDLMFPTTLYTSSSISTTMGNTELPSHLQRRRSFAPPARPNSTCFLNHSAVIPEPSFCRQSHTRITSTTPTLPLAENHVDNPRVGSHRVSYIQLNPLPSTSTQPSSIQLKKLPSSSPSTEPLVEVKPEPATFPPIPSQTPVELPSIPALPTSSTVKQLHPQSNTSNTTDPGPETEGTNSIVLSKGYKFKCFAFVVGNKSYPNHLLKNGLNDATSVSEFLQTRCDFEVRCCLDIPTLEEFNNRLNDFKQLLKDSKAGKSRMKIASIFFFSGHGRQLKGHTFLLMTADETTMSPQSDTACLKKIAPIFGKVIDEIHALSHLTIGISDSCREHITGSSTNPEIDNNARCSDDDDVDDDEFTTRGFGPLTPTGRMLFYATDPGATARDVCKLPNRKMNGFFTGCFLEAAESASPGTPFSEIAANTINSVRKLSIDKQCPWLSGCVGTPFALF
ncbi:hypothetical protein Pelo_1968 [Pelomyxa schiedti]|nr:hypothetical protein Pelo_1968 [Pelomyxa schiedti]